MPEQSTNPGPCGQFSGGATTALFTLIPPAPLARDAGLAFHEISIIEMVQLTALENPTGLASSEQLA
jgi:hypothetical protein